ncbi:MAG: hypothetical protein MZW92_55370 [Comamonadaceae bacterium]|nr:hypothetical protein [Comamonadaceae bacterium]
MRRAGHRAKRPAPGRRPPRRPDRSDHEPTRPKPPPALAPSRRPRDRPRRARRRLRHDAGRSPRNAPLDDLLRQAETARVQGDRDRARQQWHDAARLHPLSATPWRPLAEDHFKAGENGSAIVAAQEAARRDPQDRVAQAILAVGGLRVSTGALAALGERDGVPADTRGEAVALTRLLRETLGEPVLVPAPEAPRTPTRTRRAARPAGTGATTPAPAPAPAPATASGARVPSVPVTAVSPSAAATAPRSASRHAESARRARNPCRPGADDDRRRAGAEPDLGAGSRRRAGTAGAAGRHRGTGRAPRPRRAGHLAAGQPVRPPALTERRHPCPSSRASRPASRSCARRACG